MKRLILAASALALSSAAASAETVVIAPDGGERTTTVAPSTETTVVEPRGTVVEEPGPYAPRLEPNTQVRKRTPNVGDGTSSSRNANQN